MILFRGREQSRPEQGVRLLQRFAEDVSEYGVVEFTPTIDGRNMVMVIGPLKSKADAKAAQAKEKEDARVAAPAAPEPETPEAKAPEKPKTEEKKPAAVAKKAPAAKKPAAASAAKPAAKTTKKKEEKDA
jgi:translation initiation factor IF-3